MAERVGRQLPRGRHGLTRDQVETDQRLRIFMGMAEAMREKGYVGTPVADIIKRAGVSRETFYGLYDDKLDAFLAAFDLVGEVLLERLRAALLEPGSPMEHFERAVVAYLDLLASEPGHAQLFLVEVHAAGPAAMARRTAVQHQIVDAMVDLLDLRSPADRFTCQVLVAGVGAMVTGPLVAGDLDALGQLAPLVVDHVHRLHDAGLLGAPTRSPSVLTEGSS